MPSTTSEPIRITPREFQLVLLRRMADYQPELVEKARGELGASVTEMREVNAHWQRMQRSRGYRSGLPALRAFLGEPAAQLPRRIGDLSCRATQWKLSLWPDLRYEALSLLPAGQLLAEMLVRDPDAPEPGLEGIGDLTPWSCVIGDVERAFAPVQHREGSAPSRWTTMFTVPGENGAPVRAVAEFVYGLLQTVRVGDR
ncbi:MAG: hypothetical protein ACRDVE_15555 [Actinocrinis sp.]